MSFEPEISALIVAGGLSTDPRRLQAWVQRYDLIIAADSGAERLVEIGIEPHLVTGDFDSISATTRGQIPLDRLMPNPDQEDTDLEKAIRIALDRGVSEIGIACASGNRLDHTLNAISMLLRYEGRARFVLYDDGGEATLVHAPEAIISGRPGQKVSLIPAPAAHGLQGEGLRYPLSGMDLVFGGKDAVSNELTASTARVHFSSGSMLVYLQYPDAG